MHFVVQWVKKMIFRKNGFQQREQQSLSICSCVEAYLNYLSYSYLLARSQFTGITFCKWGSRQCMTVFLVCFLVCWDNVEYLEGNINLLFNAIKIYLLSYSFCILLKRLGSGEEERNHKYNLRNGSEGSNRTCMSKYSTGLTMLTMRNSVTDFFHVLDNKSKLYIFKTGLGKNYIIFLFTFPQQEIF